MGEKLALILLLALSSWTDAQSPPRGDAPPDAIIPEEPLSCSGSVAGAVVITIIVIIASATASYCLYNYKRKSKTGKNKIDPEYGSNGGYDNPQFIGDEGCVDDRAKNVSPAIRTTCETSSRVISTATNTSGTLDRGKSAIEKVLSAVVGGVRIGSSHKIKDDSCLEPRQSLVPLQGRDFSGLGFTIIGNLKEGIFIKDVLLRGPASESGKVIAGDKILAVTVLMDHMVYEDAQTILSYASPYPVILHLESGKPMSSPLFFKGKASPSSSKLKGCKDSSTNYRRRIAHPKLSRSQSFEKVSSVAVQVRNLTTPKEISPRITKSSKPSFAPQGPAKEVENYVKREGINRYSERAIDVPGAQEKVRESESETGTNQSTSALTSVQVHRTTQEADEIDSSSTTDYGKVNRNQEIVDKKLNHEESKPKFGVKVLPEIISFKEKNVKNNYVKKPYADPSNTKSKQTLEGNQVGTTVSSISISSSKKGEAPMELPKTSSSSEDDMQSQACKIDSIVSNDGIDVRGNSKTEEVKYEKKGSQIKVNHSLASADSTISPSLTFFSHVNFPQTSNIPDPYLQSNLRGSDNTKDQNKHQDDIVDADMHDESATSIADIQTTEINSTSVASPRLNEEAPSRDSTPDISHDLDDVNLSEINATDATKKRKYRYMLANSSILLPDNHQIEDIQLSRNGAQDLWENQSDEAKSRSLKAKSTNVNVDTEHNGSLTMQDDLFYSENMPSTSMPLDLDDIEMEEDENVSDEKKMKVSTNNTLPIAHEEIDNSIRISSTNGELENGNFVSESKTDGQTRNNGHKLSFTEFALSDAIPIDMTALSFNTNKDEPLNNREDTPRLNKESFGRVFGFQGFRNRINSKDESESKADVSEPTSNTLDGNENNFTEIESNIGHALENAGNMNRLDSTNLGEDEIPIKTADAQLSKTEDVILSSVDLNKGLDVELEASTHEDSKKTKSKMNFGFRGLSKSSSDTDEEKNKVSRDPTGRPEKKSKVKSGLPFRFRSRSRSSDSEDNSDRRKIKIDPSGVDLYKIITNQKSDVHKLKYSKEASNDTNKSDDAIKIQKPPRQVMKKHSDSEEELQEIKINCDPKGSQEKSKDSKSKSLKLGFKGFKSLKGKIQTEINKIRQESTLSDEDSSHIETKEVNPERAKILNNEEDMISPDVDTLMMEHAASAAKENRRKISRNSSSSAISSEEEGDSLHEQRKKKKTKSKKRVDKNRIVTTGVMQVELPSTETNTEVNEVISAETRAFQVDVPNLDDIEDSFKSPDITTINTVDVIKTDLAYKPNQNIEAKDLPRYVVKTEMKLTPRKSFPNECSIEEVFDKVVIERKIPRPMLIEENACINIGTDTDGGSYGSDSDLDRSAEMERSCCEPSINLVAPSKRKLTDSEELKRKTASLGDLSRINDSLNSGSILERAVSLDLNTTTDNHGALHVKRLKLPDSSATSIDEVDEKVPYSPIKLEQVMGLKGAGQWGTLEEALQLSNRDKILQHSLNHYGNEVNGFAEYVQQNGIEDKSVSNIEISGECGPSITSLSSNEDLWNSISYDTHPLSDVIPESRGKTTITLQNDGSHCQENHYKSDSSIVIVPDSSVDRIELSNVKVQVPSLSGSTPDVLLISNNFNSDDRNPEYNSDLHGGEYIPNANELGSNKVTLTMISAEDPDYQSPLTFPAPPIPPKPKTNQPSISPDLQSFDSGISAPLVTVNNDWSLCDPDVNVESSDLNSSDELITPSGSPQKSMTQIALDGVGVSGYMVQDGDFSKTVIISNPDLLS